MRIIFKKPKTKWQKRKEKLVMYWNLFTEAKAGIVGIGIFICFIIMALTAWFFLQ